jgi:hypothetical protein
MRQRVRYGRTIVALGLALVTANPGPVGAAIFDDASAITLPSGDLSTEATGIRKVLEAYVHAVEAKDVQMFRAVKPNLSEEEEKRARRLKSVQSQVEDERARPGRGWTERRRSRSRRDTINVIVAFPDFQLAKEPRAGRSRHRALELGSCSRR